MGKKKSPGNSLITAFPGPYFGRGARTRIVRRGFHRMAQPCENGSVVPFSYKTSSCNLMPITLCFRNFKGQIKDRFSVIYPLLQLHPLHIHLVNSRQFPLFIQLSSVHVRDRSKQLNVLPMPVIAFLITTFILSFLENTERLLV